MPEQYHEYAGRLARAYKDVDTDATHAQREAMRARVGRCHIHGLDIRVEYPPGAYRTGVGADGKTWSRKMVAAYGRIKRTVGRDGEPVDVFIGEHPESQLVFVVDQLDAGGNLDEHKVVLATRNYQEARDLYLAHYPPGWADDRLGEVRGFHMPQFRRWLKTDAPKKNRAKSKSAADLIAELIPCPSPTA